MVLDSVASTAVAHAPGGRFVRAFVTGGYVGDFGVMASRGADCLRRRAELGADAVQVIANITAGLSVPLAPRPLQEAARGAGAIALAGAGGPHAPGARGAGGPAPLIRLPPPVP